ncbi:Putative peptidyl-prolyl cis-trans isomerase [Gimesia panareensis]|uniref:peptidylprolyl isomerase n=1 Tax=Gimesia panareensis TaxID=2527978 RepID=A0A518FTW7_9PLAN|nr:peptidylprolyl isomerase [Gimesia panareensis]QDV19782.1 Putative peptidyl-prolyl cis-trans isomerase [Gimesia panareensis]
MISKLIDNLWRPRRRQHHRRLKKATTPLAATEKLEDRTLLSGQDLIAFGQALSAANVTLYGAAWDADTTAQKALLEDGASYLNFVDITNFDRTLNGSAADVGISDAQNLRPIWKLNDGTLIEGSSINSLQDLATATGVAITNSDGPYLKDIPTQNLLANTGLHVALDGFDPDGGPLTYTVESSNPTVSARVLTGNRSLRISVAGYGDMVFELFEGRVPRATDHIIELTQVGFYNDSPFFKILGDSLIHGGDPTGTGMAGSYLGPFDDQFHPELQHVQTGLLSMAKGFDDTNDNQFIITEGSDRTRDYNNTIFGYLVEGEDVREAISNVPVVNGEDPVFDVRMETVDVFTDQENGTLFLNAPEGYSGSSTITVTVTDQDGNQQQRQFQVNVQPDSITAPHDVGGNPVYDPADANPYLLDIPTLQVRAGETIQYQLQAVDVDATAQNNSPFSYYDENTLKDPANDLPVPVFAPPGLIYGVDATNQGILTISPDASLAPGVYQVTVAVGFQSNAIDYQIVTVVVTDPPVANNDFVALQGDTPATFDIFANDTDSDGTVVRGSAEIISQPAHGTVSLVYEGPTNPEDINDDYKIQFTPDGSGYMGIDSFTYRVKDNFGAYSNVATVEFSIAPEGVILVTSKFDTHPNNRVTLRQAILAANLDTAQGAAPAGQGTDIIMFDPALFAGNTAPLEITLSGDLAITDSVTIIAPTSAEGAPLLTLNGNASDRNFTINDGLASNLVVGLQNLKLINGKIADNGGSIFNAETLVITNSEITGNQSTSDLGGAIYNTGSLEIYDSLIQSNSSQYSSGGGIVSQSGSVILSGTTVDQNNAEGFGGGIYAIDSSITLNNSTVSTNVSSNGGGGGIYQNGGTLTLNGSTITDNTTGAATDGGGLYVFDTTTTVTDSTFYLNRSSGSGGGLRQSGGSLTVRGSTFYDNSALFGDGGAISSGADTTALINSTLSGNSAEYNGGGIFFSNPVDFVSGIINNSTIANNTANQSGGGLYASFDTITLNNTLIADNSASSSGNDVSAYVNGSYSLIESAAGINNDISGFNFITGQDPGLLPLADNGGLTLTHALNTSSIAIDAGDPGFDPSTFTPELTLDQRGSARVADGNHDSTSRVDIGAYEAESVLGSADLTVKWNATNTGGTGQVGSLPANVNFLDEWSPVVVEIWVSITNSTENGVASAAVDFSFDATYLTADSIEYGPGFTQSQTGTIDNNNGTITGLGASTSQTAYGAETLVLLARVNLTVKPIDLNADGQYIHPVGNVDFQISNSIVSSAVGNAAVTEGAAVNLALVPALYDLDDSGRIDFRDLILFVAVYNKTTGASGADGAWAADFDHSGRVDFRDLTYLAANYNRVQGVGNALVYPPNFNEIWQQNNLVAASINSVDTGTQPLTSEAVEPVLEAAKQQVAASTDETSVEQLSDVKIEIVELSDNQLARADSTTNTIYLDVNAAGWGWFVDSTPFSNTEFDATDDPRIFSAGLLSPAAGQIDLLTVLLHELNHLLGHEHTSDSSVMDPVLATGERKLMETQATDDFFGSYLDPEFGGIN